MQEHTWPVLDDEVLGTLPPVLRAIVKALGFGRASEFLNAHGGLNINVPKRKTQVLCLDEHELARLRVTLKPHMDAASRVWLPKPDKLFNIIRNQAILKAKDKQTISAQVREYKLSNRQILNIRNALTKDERMSQVGAGRKNLRFSPEELLALKMLAEEKMHATKNAVYANILNKLNRAQLQAVTKNSAVQIDLF